MIASAVRIVADGKEPGSVPAMPVQDHGPGDLRRLLGRLETLPMRPATARLILARSEDDEPGSEPSFEPSTRAHPSLELDPALALARSRSRGSVPDPLAFVADHRWWPASEAGGPVAEALDRLWKFSTAVGFASRRLARELGLDDPESVARAGFLHGLGLWALASVAPEFLVEWFATPDPIARRALERRWLGAEASSLGRELAGRWGCEPLVVDAAWLHDDGDGALEACSNEPSRLAAIRQAFALARRTPWAPGVDELREPGPGDPRVKILTAEVQSRCAGNFVVHDSSAREERLTRENARLRLAITRLRTEQDSQGRFIRAVIDSSPGESPEAWAERAGLALCGEPGVSSARVHWLGTGVVLPSQAVQTSAFESVRLGEPTRPSAILSMSRDSEQELPPSTMQAWDSWALVVEERARLRARLDEALSTLRDRVDREASSRRKATLDALAEFAAGAGHELNNPLAVILGRAQLLLAREDDPEAVRSLRTIVSQSQKAHRILRDLMYIARPPDPRPRPCQPEEIVRSSLHDLQPEAEVRGVRLVVESRESPSKVWADPDSLRQIAAILARNALEATPSGGVVRFLIGSEGRILRWTVHDTGRGIAASEGLHLFDPFYCGRQAGRGLGLGLPRAARIVEQVGGDLRWKSSPGHGTVFQVTLPVEELSSPSD